MVIITMQSGFGLLESGFVSKKNEINIMIKNVVDITLGGIMFWAFGYGLGFGQSEYANEFIGFGDFFFDVDTSPSDGWKSANYFFQLTFSTTATTIVSGALAERCRFRAYCLFALMNTLIYSVPAHWIFAELRMAQETRRDRFRRGRTSPPPGRYDCFGWLMDVKTKTQ
jgi:ammonia channel protein AmtB